MLAERARRARLDKMNQPGLCMRNCCPEDHGVRAALGDSRRVRLKSEDSELY